MFAKSVCSLALGLLVVLGCTPEECEKWPDACPNFCGVCPCPVGTACVEGNVCASKCALVVDHDPPGNPCGHINALAVCEEFSEALTQQGIGVCRAPTGAPLCWTPPGDT